MALVTGDDVHKAIELLRELKSKADSVSSYFKGLVQNVHNDDISTAKGVSFLEVKYQLLLSYLANLTHLMCNKTSGKSIQRESSIERLIEIRTVLEKIRPIDQKLKYQIDKLIKTATTGIGENDPLRFKPNPDNLESKLDSDDSESGSEVEEGRDGASSKIYKPPKLAAMHYEGDETEQDRMDKRRERLRKAALSSSIIRDLKDEYYEGPEEIRDTLDIHRLKDDKKGKDRQEYEEKYFMRMPITKKEKTESRRLATVSGLGDLTRFSDISALAHEEKFDDDDGPQRKKAKTGKKGKGSFTRVKLFLENIKIL